MLITILKRLRLVVAVLFGKPVRALAPFESTLFQALMLIDHLGNVVIGNAPEYALLATGKGAFALNATFTARARLLVTGVAFISDDGEKHVTVNLRNVREPRQMDAGDSITFVFPFGVASAEVIPGRKVVTFTVPPVGV